MNEMPDLKVRVLVVWEPILITDRGGPKAGALNRVPDARARHYWDRNHYLSSRLGGVAGAARFPDTKILFAMGKYVWDFVAVYPPGGKWRDVARKPVFSGGAVVKVKSDLREGLRRAAVKR
ncbi:MAG: hypothetical protein ABIZ80_04900 [Bryobacteraceae bacterium]